MSTKSLGEKHSGGCSCGHNHEHQHNHSHGNQECNCGHHHGDQKASSPSHTETCCGDKKHEHEDDDIGDEHDHSIHHLGCNCGHDDEENHKHKDCDCSHEHHSNVKHDYKQDDCSCGHIHHQHKEHSDECGCGQDHGHNHNHEECEHDHHSGHGENCSCGHDHEHEIASNNSALIDGGIPKHLKSQIQSFIVSGVDCPECAKGVQRAVGLLNGVSYASYNFSTSILKVVHDIDNEDIITTVRKMGYKVTLRKSRRESLAFKPWWQEPKAIITGIATLFWLAGGVTMLLTASETIKTTILSVAILFGVIYPTKAALIALKNKMALDMNVLMVIAVIGAIYLGEFFEAATVTVLFSIGKMLESYSMDKTRQSIRSLMSLAPRTALVRRNGIEQELAVEDVIVNDIVIIKPGMKIAVDGDIVKGYSSVNQAPITGESLPVSKEVGDNVFAGTINEEGYLEIKVTRSVGDTTLDQIIELVEEAQSQRAPSQQFVDVFAKYYTPVVILIALGIISIPPLVFGADFTKSLYSGISLLVVSCPCALVISTPVSIVSAIGNAAKNGILIKGGAYLELAGKINAIAFDKTGTLTRGEPRVTTVETFSDLSEQRILQLAATVEEVSEHPLAKAIVEYAKEKDIKYARRENFESLTGRGVKAMVDDGLCIVCKPDYAVMELKIQIDNIKKDIESLQQQGNTAMLVIYNNEIVGLVAVADMLRDESIKTVDKLKSIGIKNVIMLTGDNENTAKAIAKRLNLSGFKANLLPDQKVSAINELLNNYERVAMVGDGVNDAPALATSSVGIAMGGAGTDTALETADIVLMADDLKMLPYTMLLSRRTLNIIKQNIIFSIIVKLIAILLIFPGWLTLWIAVMADTGAALVVILNGMRLLRMKRK